MATKKTGDESLLYLWEECRPQQQLTQTAFAKGSQEAIVWECG